MLENLKKYINELRKRMKEYSSQMDHAKEDITKIFYREKSNELNTIIHELEDLVWENSNKDFDALTTYVDGLPYKQDIYRIKNASTINYISLYEVLNDLGYWKSTEKEYRQNIFQHVLNAYYILVNTKDLGRDYSEIVYFNCPIENYNLYITKEETHKLLCVDRYSIKEY